MTARDGGAAPRGWRGELELWFDAPAPGRTRLARRRHVGPLAVQRPFYPEADGTCHVYLLHPPGGLAGGDELHIRLHVGEGARCVLTTPGAARFYRTASARARQHSTVAVAAGAVCEYLPQETIVFDGAEAGVETRVTLQGDAVYTGWDFICLGRPAAGERFDRGSLTQCLEIGRAGRRLWFERLRVAGGSPLLDARHAFAGQPVSGTMVHAGPLEQGLDEAVRREIGEAGGRRFSVSQRDDVVVCRYLGPQAEEGKALFTRAWHALRMATRRKPASAPRIWAT